MTQLAEFDGASSWEFDTSFGEAIPPWWRVDGPLVVLPDSEPGIAWNDWNGAANLTYRVANQWRTDNIPTAPHWGGVRGAHVLRSGRVAVVVGERLYIGNRECKGDMDCNGDVEFGDIALLIQALQGRMPWEQHYPACPWLNGDCNNDQTVTFDDIDAFVALIGTTCSP